MTAKEFVLNKYPNAFIQSKKSPAGNQRMYSIYLNKNEHWFVWNHRANWAWVEAKRKIIEQQNTNK